MENIDVQSLAALAVASPLIITIVAGFVEMVKALFDRNFRVAVIVAVSGIVGGVLGAFAIEGLNFWYGLMAGFSASGAITIAQNIGSPVDRTE